MKATTALFVAAISTSVWWEAHAFGLVTPWETRNGPAATTTASSLKATTVAEEPPAEVVNPRLEGLALALDEGTRKSHSMAENTAFVQGFFKGISGPESYKNLLTSLYYVYQAMESEVLDVAKAAAAERAREDDAAGSQDAEWIRALDVAPLRRLAGLEQDMEYFYGPNWKQDIRPPSQGTKAYVGRIRELAKSLTTQDKDIDDQSDETTNTPSESLLYLFVAHQYTRYLGDLFGGQMMGSMASKSMDLPADGSGVAFYTFDQVDSTKDFITDWYTSLNALGASHEQQQAIVDEANRVFVLNIGILEELEGSPWKAVWTMARSTAQEFADWTKIKESKNHLA